MLKPKKKITKREIKEDKLVTTYFRAQEWYEENRKRMGSIVFGIIIAAAAVWFYFNNRANQNRSAITDLGKIVAYVDLGRYESAINGVPEHNLRGLQQIVDDYGSTPTGEVAKLYLANSYFALGNYEKALQYYEDAEIDDKSLQASAVAGAASCHEALGHLAEAARLFEDAANLDAGNLHTAEYLHHAVRNYVAAGNGEKASEVLERLAKEYPNSTYTRESDRFKASIAS